MESKKKYSEILKDANIYELLAEESPNWICIIHNNKIVYGNKQFLKNVGYKQRLETQRGFALSTIIQGKDKKSVAEGIQRTIKQGRAAPLEFHIIAENGNLVDVVQINRVIEYGGTPALFSMLIPVAELPDLNQSEKALKESEERYRLLVENSTDIIYKTDLKGNYTYANKAFLKQTGYKESEILKMNCFELIKSDHHDQIREVYSSQLNKRRNNVVKLEIPCLTKEKKLVWISQHSRLELDDLGNPIGFLLSARDITKQHETEEALTQESKALKEDYKTLVETMNEGIVRVDTEETILYVNNRFCKMFGYTEKELLGRNFMDLILSNKESKTKVRSAFELRKKGKPSSYQVMAMKKSGEMVWCSINGSPLLQNDEVIGSMGIVMDITEEVKVKEALITSENNLQKAHEIGHLGTYDWEIGTGLISWNEQMYEIYGVNKNKKITLELTEQFVHPDDRELISNAITNAMRTGTTPITEYRLLRKDGQIKYCLARSKAFFDQNGNPIRVIGTIQDITDQKLAEIKIKELNESLEKRVVERTEQLEKANKEIRSLLQEMHHRVKNNLQIVSSLMNLQANSIQEQKYSGIFEESRDRIHAMAIIHENLYLGESVSEINLKEYIEPLIEGRIRANQSMDNKLTLDLSIPSKYFNIDVVLPLGLLLNELVTNTIKHAFPKGRDGLIQVTIKNTGGNKYKLDYRDNGVGFKEDKSYPSLGLVLIDSFIMQLDAKLSRKSNSKGTHYSITFLMGE